MDKALVKFVGAGLSTVVIGLGRKVPVGAIANGHYLVGHLLETNPVETRQIIEGVVREVFVDWKKSGVPLAVADIHLDALPQVLDQHRIAQNILVGGLAVAKKSAKEGRRAVTVPARRIAAEFVTLARESQSLSRAKLGDSITFFLVERMFAHLLMERHTLLALTASLNTYFMKSMWMGPASASPVAAVALDASAPAPAADAPMLDTVEVVSAAKPVAAAPAAAPSPVRPDHKNSATGFGRERETAMFGSDDAPRSVAFKPLALPQQERPLFNAVEPMPRIRQTERPIAHSAPAAEMAPRFNRQPSATDLEFRMPRPPMAPAFAGLVDGNPAPSGAVTMPAAMPAHGLSRDGHAADFAATPHSPVELVPAELAVSQYSTAAAPSDLAEAEVDLARLFGTEPVAPAHISPATTSPLYAGPQHSGDVMQAVDQPVQSGLADPGFGQHAYAPPVPLPDFAAPLVELLHPLGSTKVRRVRKIVIAPTHSQQQSDAVAMPSAFDHQPAPVAADPFDLPLPGLDELLDEQFMDFARPKPSEPAADLAAPAGDAAPSVVAEDLLPAFVPDYPMAAIMVVPPMALTPELASLDLVAGAVETPKPVDGTADAAPAMDLATGSAIVSAAVDEAPVATPDTAEDVAPAAINGVGEPAVALGVASPSIETAASTPGDLPAGAAIETPVETSVVAALATAVPHPILSLSDTTPPAPPAHVEQAATARPTVMPAPVAPAAPRFNNPSSAVMGIVRSSGGEITVPTACAIEADLKQHGAVSGDDLKAGCKQIIAVMQRLAARVVEADEGSDACNSALDAVRAGRFDDARECLRRAELAAMEDAQDGGDLARNALRLAVDVRTLHADLEVACGNRSAAAAHLDEAARAVPADERMRRWTLTIRRARLLGRMLPVKTASGTEQDRITGVLAAYRDALALIAEHDAPQDFGRAQVEFAMLLNRSARSSGLIDPLNEASAFIDQTIDTLARCRAMDDWAEAHTQRGVVYAQLAKFEEPREHQERAAYSFNCALGQISAQRSLAVWTEARAWLGLVLKQMGKASHEASSLAEGVTHLRAVCDAEKIDLSRTGLALSELALELTDAIASISQLRNEPGLHSTAISVLARTITRVEADPAHDVVLLGLLYDRLGDGLWQLGGHRQDLEMLEKAGRAMERGIELLLQAGEEVRAEARISDLERLHDFRATIMEQVQARESRLEVRMA